MAAQPAAGAAQPVILPVALSVAIAPNPLDDVRTVLTVRGLAPNIDRFVTCHGISSLDDFEFIDHTETELVVKMHNDRYHTAAQKIGFPVQKKLKGFQFWYPDRLCRQEPIVIARSGNALLMP